MPKKRPLRTSKPSDIKPPDISPPKQSKQSDQSKDQKNEPIEVILSRPLREWNDFEAKFMSRLFRVTKIQQANQELQEVQNTDGSDKNIYTCYICKQKFDNSKDLVTHNVKHVKLSPDKSEAVTENVENYQNIPSTSKEIPQPLKILKSPLSKPIKQTKAIASLKIKPQTIKAENKRALKTETVKTPLKTETLKQIKTEISKFTPTLTKIETAKHIQTPPKTKANAQTDTSKENNVETPKAEPAFEISTPYSRRKTAKYSCKHCNEEFRNSTELHEHVYERECYEAPVKRKRKPKDEQLQNESLNESFDSKDVDINISKAEKQDTDEKKAPSKKIDANSDDYMTYIKKKKHIDSKEKGKTQFEVSVELTKDDEEMDEATVLNDNEKLAKILQECTETFVSPKKDEKGRLENQKQTSKSTSNNSVEKLVCVTRADPKKSTKKQPEVKKSASDTKKANPALKNSKDTVEEDIEMLLQEAHIGAHSVINRTPQKHEPPKTPSPTQTPSKTSDGSVQKPNQQFNSAFLQFINQGKVSSDVDTKKLVKTPKKALKISNDEEEYDAEQEKSQKVVLKPDYTLSEVSRMKNSSKKPNTETKKLTPFNKFEPKRKPTKPKDNSPSPKPKPPMPGQTPGKNEGILCSLCTCRQINDCHLSKHMEDFHQVTMPHTCEPPDGCYQDLCSCHFCGLVISGGTKRLKQHIEETHFSRLTRFSCPKCPRLVFNLRRSLAKHLRAWHQIPECDKDPEIRELLSSQSCVLCHKTFFEHCNMTIHMKYQRKHFIIECPECQLEFADLLQMTRHHDNKHLHKCGYCNMKFKYMPDVAHHVFTVHPTSEFDNEVTQEENDGTQDSFSSADDSMGKNHVVIKMQGREDLFVCSQCSRKFDTPNATFRHFVMKHSNLTYCKQCSKELFTQSDMVQHIKRYHGKNFNGFFCFVCDENFGKQVEKLNRHLKRVHNVPETILY